MNHVTLLARLRKSLLPLPVLFTLGAIGLAVVTSVVDRRLGFESGLFPGGAESARSLLSSIASASMTLTAVVFSITMLVLQLTSAQYSPRVLHRFLRDRVSQLALASFASTFAFSLAALRGVAPDTVPVTSVAIGLLLALATIGVFVVYVNHIAQQIQVSSIISSIEGETRAAFDSLHDASNDDAPAETWPSAGPTEVVPAPRAGVVTAVNVSGMTSAARHLDAAVELIPLVGDWVAEGAPLLRAHATEDIGDGSRLTRHVSLADERDMDQDPPYGIRQLVDIAERALSPGTNDPTTAVQAVHAVHSLLVRITDRRTPTGIACDEDGKPRFRRRHRTFPELLELSVNEILLYGRSSLQVTKSLETMLVDLLRVAKGERADAVRAKLGQVRAERSKLLSGEAWFAATLGLEGDYPSRPSAEPTEPAATPPGDATTR